MIYDVIIAGGGPAGLSAALILGRCRRRVLVCDAGHPRNARSHGLHGFLSRDGIKPAELLSIARRQLKPYGVAIRKAVVSSAARTESGFKVSLEDGENLESRRLLVATGVVDRLPPIQDVGKFYGRSVFHCPYCDGWEMRDQPVAVYGKGKSGAALSLSLKTWSPDVVLCTDGAARLSTTQREQMVSEGILVLEEPIARLEGRHGVMKRILFRNGEFLSRRALFFSTGQQQSCDLAHKLGCRFTSKGAVVTTHLEETHVPGLYVAGDASRDVQLVIVAAAEGAKAGCAINQSLAMEDLEARRAATVNVRGPRTGRSKRRVEARVRA